MEVCTRHGARAQRNGRNARDHQTSASHSTKAMRASTRWFQSLLMAVTTAALLCASSRTTGPFPPPLTATPPKGRPLHPLSATDARTELQPQDGGRREAEEEMGRRGVEVRAPPTNAVRRTSRGCHRLRRRWLPPGLHWRGPPLHPAAPTVPSHATAVGGKALVFEKGGAHGVDPKRGEGGEARLRVKEDSGARRGCAPRRIPSISRVSGRGVRRG